MPLVTVVVALALLAAAAVIGLAAADQGRERADESPWQAFRRGWRNRRAPLQPDRPVDVSLTELLVGAESGDDYVSVAELQETFDRARERAIEQTTELATHLLPGRHQPAEAHR